MNCVAEIMFIRARAEIEYKEEQERLDLLAREERKEKIVKTIEYCETTINDFFVAKAQNRVVNPQFEIKCVISKDRNDFEMITPLKVVKSNYADLRTEHRPDYEIGFDFLTLKEYLEQFCYTVKVVKDEYWHYDRGSNRANKIIISLE